MPYKNTIIVFVKNPIEGNVKTRLAKTIGNAAATNFYKHCLDYTLSVLKKIENAQIMIYYGDFVSTNDLWNGFGKYQQTGEDLGQRMENAFQEQFLSGAENILIIGSDCLELRPEHLNGAFETLNNTEVVFGPAQDGGYYLLGMKKLHACIFHDKAWSTEILLSQTLAELQEKNIAYQLLETLSDVDTYEEYKRFVSTSSKTVQELFEVQIAQNVCKSVFYI